MPKDRIITITCNEYDSKDNKVVQEEMQISYEFFDTIPPANTGYVIKQAIYEMRDRMKKHLPNRYKQD